MDWNLYQDLKDMGLTIVDYVEEGKFVVFYEYPGNSILGVCNATVADFEEAWQDDWFHVEGL